MLDDQRKALRIWIAVGALLWPSALGLTGFAFHLGASWREAVMYTALDAMLAATWLLVWQDLHQARWIGSNDRSIA